MPGKEHFKSHEVRHGEEQLAFCRGLFFRCEICQNLSYIPEAFPKRASGPGLRDSYSEEDVNIVKEMGHSETY